MQDQTDNSSVPVRLSVVVPCYNESACIQLLYDRLSAVCQSVFGTNYKIILINDGSTDDSWAMIQDLNAQDPHVAGVNLSRNHGQQNALTAGLVAADGDVIFILDADLQDPPENLGPMFEIMKKEGADIIYGQRVTREGETWFKKFSSRAFYKSFRKYTNVPIPYDTGDYRLMNRRALDAYLAMPETHRFFRGLSTWIGMKQVAFPFNRDMRVAGQSKYPLWKMISLSIDAFTAFSIRPLKLSIYCGFLMLFVGVLFLFYALYHWFVGSEFPGLTGIISLVVLLSAAQFIVLGMIGEYLGRLYEQGKGRPLYFVHEMIGIDHKPKVKLGYVPSQDLQKRMGSIMKAGEN